MGESLRLGENTHFERFLKFSSEPAGPEDWSRLENGAKGKTGAHLRSEPLEDDTTPFKK